MSKAIAFLAGLGTGYMKAEDKKVEDARRAKLDARDEERYNADKADREQARADKQALRAAAAPVAVTPEAVKPDTMDNIDVGQPGEAAVPVTGYKVGAKSFAEKGLAETEAAAQNDPKAQRTRVAAALAAQGNVVGADQLKTSGLQAEAAQMALDKGKRDEANQMFDDGLRKALAKGPDALAQFMSDSHADGQGGAVKFKAVPSADGKSWQMHRVSEDGALAPMGQRFSNDEGGMATAGFMLSRAVPEKDKLSHMLQAQEAERKAKHDEGTLKIAQQNADTQEQYRKDQAENMRQQRALQAKHDAAVAAGKAKPGDPVQVTLKDKRDFESDLGGLIKDQYPVKDGVDDKERAAMTSQRAAKTALGNTLFQNNAQIGIPLTAGTVLQAMELAGDRKNVRIVQVNGVPHEAVVVNGQAVVTSGPMQRKEQGGNVATPATSPAAAARNGVLQPASTPNTNVLPSAPAAPPAQAAVTPEKAAALKPLADAVAQASSQMAAVAKSGDPKAIAQYTPALQQARAALQQEAIRQFGQAGAQEYLATLPF